MELFIHYTTLPEGKELADVVTELNEVLEDDGVVCGGEDGSVDGVPAKVKKGIERCKRIP